MASGDPSSPKQTAAQNAGIPLFYAAMFTAKPETPSRRVPWKSRQRRATRLRHRGAAAAMPRGNTSRTCVATGQGAAGRRRAASGLLLAGSETNRHLYPRAARQIESIAVSCAARFWDPARPWARPSKPVSETRRAKMVAQPFPPEDKIETNARSGRKAGRGWLRLCLTVLPTASSPACSAAEQPELGNRKSRGEPNALSLAW